MKTTDPKNDRSSPSYWSDRARQAREAAPEVRPMDRKILEDVAHACEEMAELLKRQK
jgi:hypothetical protein